MVNGLSERAVGENGLIAGLFHERRWRRHQPGDPLGQNRVTPRETTEWSQNNRSESGFAVWGNTHVS